MNPFLPSDSEQFALREEEYQLLYLEAVQKAIQRGKRSETPTTLPLDRLRDVVKKHGLESALLHPTDLATLFAGISHSVYRTIADFYCSHLGRSIPMVWKLLDAMARQAQVPSPSYEAVWACCFSFEQRRREMLTIKAERGSATWWLGQLELNCLIRMSARESKLIVSPVLCYIADSSTGQMLANGIAPKDASEEHNSLMLYEAILLQRRPAKNAATGLVWHLPQRLVTTFSLSMDCQKACRALGIVIECLQESPTFAQALQSNWADTLTGRVLLPQQCLLLLEAYLIRYAPPGPARLQEERAREYGHLLSYQRDATWHFPLLRAFLPRREATITMEGTLIFQGLHYADPLLAYWTSALVSLRFSPGFDALIWVYLEGEILCQAYARERRPQKERHQALHPGR
jgi:hypothetical protein